MFSKYSRAIRVSVLFVLWLVVSHLFSGCGCSGVYLVEYINDGAKIELLQRSHVINDSSHSISLLDNNRWNNNTDLIIKVQLTDSTISRGFVSEPKNLSNYAIADECPSRYVSLKSIDRIEIIATDSFDSEHGPNTDLSDLFYITEHNTSPVNRFTNFLPLHEHWQKYRDTYLVDYIVDYEEGQFHLLLEKRPHDKDSFQFKIHFFEASEVLFSAKTPVIQLH